MSSIDKLIEAIKLRDLEQVRTILNEDGELVHSYDATGATALHYAAFDGFREIVQLLLDRGAEINSRDKQFGATPVGWAIEYLRERGGYLGIELGDLEYAIELGDARWVARFLQRFPALRQGRGINGKPFRELAEDRAIQKLWLFFEISDGY